MIKDKTMNVYERIINILLEARVDMFIQDRLDEAKLKGKQGKLDVNKNKKLDSQDFEMLRSGKRSDESKNSAAIRAFMKSRAGKAADVYSKSSGAAVSTRAEEKAGAARRGVPAGQEGPPQLPNKKEARRQIGRAAMAKQVDKPYIP
jgi:hypothetical protein